MNKPVCKQTLLVLIIDLRCKDARRARVGKDSKDDFVTHALLVCLEPHGVINLMMVNMIELKSESLDIF